MLEGKHAVITGGGTGIGLSIAQALAGAGAEVTITGRRAEVLEAVAGPGLHPLVMDVTEDGRLTNARVWADVTGEGEGVPDGMKTTTEGHILCNGPGGVHLFDADATCLGVILTPQKSTNFCFGGPAFRTLFITASTSVYRIETALTGLAMF